ncbi:hypothetical protein NE850_38305 [Paraburkholderia sp. USG1]|uniref:hypothetical protein n=1 Tax=Paraburkholderia sp. USG1 TaxID=2952268 RepID=UPI00285F3EB1|nr:hypothetical protein [Paraburkholderia sp. USG1]MDR8402179.1 hypothetical protein [Paraburkholderia sp. USG1]
MWLGQAYFDALASQDSLTVVRSQKASTANLTDQDVLQLSALPQAPTVPNPSVAAKGAEGKLGRRAMPNAAAML